MRKSIVKYGLPVVVGIVLSVITATAFISTTFTGCIKEEPTSSSGCGSQMGCCPTTGCGTGWKSSCTGLCYTTSTACQQAGPPVGCYSGSCRQCY